MILMQEIPRSAASASAATYGLNVNFIDTGLANPGTAFAASVSSSELTEQTKSALTKSITNSQDQLLQFLN